MSFFLTLTWAEECCEAYIFLAFSGSVYYSLRYDLVITCCSCHFYGGQKIESKGELLYLVYSWCLSEKHHRHWAICCCNPPHYCIPQFVSRHAINDHNKPCWLEISHKNQFNWDHQSFPKPRSPVSTTDVTYVLMSVLSSSSEQFFLNGIRVNCWLHSDHCLFSSYTGIKIIFQLSSNRFITLRPLVILVHHYRVWIALIYNHW